MPVIKRVIDELDRILEPDPRESGAAIKPVQPQNIPQPITLPGSAPNSTGVPIQAPLAPRAQAAPITPVAQGHRDELNRLESSPSGVSAIRNPYARVPLQVLGAIGGGLFPGIEQRIPGTQGHHEVLTHQARQNVKTDEELANDESKRQLEAAQAVNAEAQPDARAMTAENARLRNEATATAAANAEAGRNTRADATLQQQLTLSQQRHAETLRKIGMRLNPTTGVEEPIPENELSEAERSKIADSRSMEDLRAAQAEAQMAKAELDRAQASGQGPAAELARSKQELALQRLETIKARLGLSQQQFEYRSQGTINGVAPVGQPTNDEGHAVSTANARYVEPTNQQRNSATQATSAVEQIKTMKAIIDKKPGLFGLGGNSAQKFTQWFASQDPDAQVFRDATTFLSEHGSATFGARAQYAQDELKTALGQFSINPTAALAGLNHALKTFQTFKDAGTTHVTTQQPNVGEVIKYERGPDGKPRPVMQKGK